MGRRRQRERDFACESLFLENSTQSQARDGAEGGQAGWRVGAYPAGVVGGFWVWLDVRVDVRGAVDGGIGHVGHGASEGVGDRGERVQAGVCDWGVSFSI